MKKFLLFPVMIIVVAGLVACGGPSKTELEKAEKDAAAAVDSLMKMASDAAVAPAADDSTAAPADSTAK